MPSNQKIKAILNIFLLIKKLLKNKERIQKIGIDFFHDNDDEYVRGLKEVI